jgi:hypothetical protein
MLATWVELRDRSANGVMVLEDLMMSHVMRRFS